MVCFDPQHGQLRLPPFDHEEVDQLIRDGKPIQAVAEMRRQTDFGLPEATNIYEQRALVLSELSRPAVPEGPAGTDRWFAILERQNGWFVQVGYGTRAGTRPGWYALEHQDGASHAHYRTITSDLQDIVAAFIGFATEDAGWTTRFAWEPYQIQK